MSPDLEVRKREISALVDGVNDLERGLPQIEGLEDFDRMEALDIVNRIERKMLAQLSLDPPPTGAYQEAET
jgi:hypothetical protein